MGAEFFVMMKESFSGIDLLVTPTVSTVAFSKDLRAPEEVLSKTGRWSKGWTLFSLPFSLTGQPTASLPYGFTSDGLPVGLQIVGKPFREITVLKASAAFEEAAPWHDYVPRINRDNS
jgi:aspartyl-tRNA(Asn)/glutamyl-tRNA(Gln) amidotransferase subunit A